MVEMAPAGEPGHFKMGFAGDTFNTAWYMRAMRPDVSTRYFSQVGTDAVSDAMLSTMTDAGIDTRYVARNPDRTVGLYMISLLNGERSFSYWRAQSAARHLADNPKNLTQAMSEADLIYFSGISIAILATQGRDTLFATAKAARADGKTIAFDSNLRPRLWKNDAEMTTTIMRFASVSDIVLPSYDDEAVHFGDDSIDATGARYLDTGAKTVVVKNGGGDVRYWHDGEVGTVSSPQAGRIVDTTSAGDSFNAGFFADLDRPHAMQDRILTASKVAGQVIANKGALVQLDHDILAR